MILKKKLTFVALLLGTLLFAQKDSTYIQNLNTRLSFKLDVNTDVQKNKYEVTTNSGQTRRFEVKPNEDYKLQLTASYRFLTLAYSYAPKFIGANDDNDEKGKTSSFHLGLNLALPKLFQKFDYTHTSGLYLENTDDFRASALRPNEKYFKLADTDIKEFKSTSHYYLNGKKHSNKLDNNQQELQLKSAGSLIIPLLFKYEAFTSGVLSPNILSITQTIPNKQTTVSANTGLGYAYHYIPKEKWYISGKAIQMIGHEWYQINFNDIPTLNNTSFVAAIQTQLSLGYNSETFFTGGKADYFYSKSLENDDNNTASESVFQVFIGYRIGAPKFLKTSFDYIEKTLGGNNNNTTIEIQH